MTPADEALFPARSVDVSVKLWTTLPLTFACKLHVPSAAALTVPIKLVPSNTDTLLFASAVPLSVVRLLANTAFNITGKGSGVARKPKPTFPMICPEALISLSLAPEIGSIIVKVPSL